jgi:hypothetical protein
VVNLLLYPLVRRSSPCGYALSLVLVTAFSAALPAQTKPNKIERREMKLEGGSATDGKFNQRDGSGDVRGNKSASEDAQARIMSKLREQFEVTDDAEWSVIAERIAKVSDLRRNLAGGTGLRASPLVGDKSKRVDRSGVSARPEQDALRAALKDKLPDAEIKVRLARVHEVHEQHEAKLARAHEELRAVLTVRQEAMAVMAGLLPP